MHLAGAVHNNSDESWNAVVPSPLSLSPCPQDGGHACDGHILARSRTSVIGRTMELVANKKTAQRAVLIGQMMEAVPSNGQALAQSRSR